MGAVKPGEYEEAAAGHAVGQVQTLLGEDGELVDLPPDEDHPEHGGGQQPEAESLMVATLDGGQRQNHRQRAHEQHE